MVTKALEGNGKNMSFVGMHIMQDGIIAFADSKASRKFTNGTCREDVKRGDMLKIFQNDKFIFVTYGNNELFSMQHKTNIEDFLLRELTKEIDYKDFFQKIDKAIQEDQATYHDGTYNFIIGSKNEYGQYFIEKCQIKQNYPINYYGRTYDYKVYSGGDEFYTTVYEKQEFFYDIDIYKYSNRIREFIEKIVIAKDSLNVYHYNPVGLPINIRFFNDFFRKNLR